MTLDPLQLDVQVNVKDQNLKAKLNLDIAQSQVQIASLKKELKTVTDTPQKIKVQADINQAQAQLKKFQWELKSMDKNWFQRNIWWLGTSLLTTAWIWLWISGAVSAISWFFKDAVWEAMAYQKNLAQVEAVIKSTGWAAGITAKQMLDMADKMQYSNWISHDTIQVAQNMLLTFTQIKWWTFKEATQAVLDMATAMNWWLAPSAEQLSTTSIRLWKALNDPVKWITALHKVWVAFTDVQKEQIKNFMKTGDVAAAQWVIIKELNTEFGGSAQAQVKTYAWQLALLNIKRDEFKEAIGKAIIPILLKLISIIDIFIPVIDNSAKSLSELTDMFDKWKVSIADYITQKKELTDKITENRLALMELNDKYKLWEISMIDYMKQADLLKEEYNKLTWQTGETAVATDALTQSIETFYKLPISTAQQRAEMEKLRQQILKNIDAQLALLETELYVTKARTTQWAGAVAMMPGETIDSLKIAWTNADKLLNKLDTLKARRKEISSANTWWWTTTPYNDASWTGWSWWASKEKAALKAIETQTEKNATTTTDYTKKIDDLQKKFDDLKATALADLADINNQMKDETLKLSDDLAKRYAEITAELEKWWQTTEEYNKLTAEKTYIEWKDTKAVLDKAVAYSKLSEAQQMVSDNDKTMAILKEKAGIAKSFSEWKTTAKVTDKWIVWTYVDEAWVTKDIVDFKNAQYALDLTNKQQALNDEQVVLAKDVADKVLLEQELATKKLEINKNYHEQVQKLIEQENTMVDNLMTRLSSLSVAWSSSVWSSTTNKTTNYGWITIASSVWLESFKRATQ